jgi:hypothetical protein
MRTWGGAKEGKKASKNAFLPFIYSYIFYTTYILLYKSL